MDIEKIIGGLRAERDRLDGVILALDRLRGAGDKLAAPRRRGRKFMDKDGRKEVSERMKRYWADQRASRAGKAKEHADGAPGDSPAEFHEVRRAQIVAA